LTLVTSSVRIVVYARSVRVAIPVSSTSTTK
jgi:hypothetical protein